MRLSPSGIVNDRQRPLCDNDAAMQTPRRFSLRHVVLAALVSGCIGVWATSRWHNRPVQVIRAFHLWYHANGATTYNNTHWLGVPTQKTPLDLWIFQEILSQVKPDVLVEAGTYKGGSAHYFASLFDLIDHGRVITVDIEDYPDKPKHPRVHFLLGSSTSPETLIKIRAALQPGEKVMVTLDSDHHKDHVLSELKLYSPLVTPGSYLVVEDTQFNGNPILPNHGPGPMEAVREFLASNHDFEPDRSREKFGMTFNPSGYLKRIR